MGDKPLAEQFRELIHEQNTTNPSLAFGIAAFCMTHHESILRALTYLAPDGNAGIEAWMRCYKRQTDKLNEASDLIDALEAERDELREQKAFWVSAAKRMDESTPELNEHRDRCPKLKESAQIEALEWVKDEGHAWDCARWHREPRPCDCHIQHVHDLIDQLKKEES